MVLSVLEGGPLHGYEIGRRIEEQSGGALRYTLAALYPMLYRMEGRGWLRGEWQTGANGKRREGLAVDGCRLTVLGVQRPSVSRDSGI